MVLYVVAARLQLYTIMGVYPDWKRVKQQATGADAAFSGGNMSKKLPFKTENALTAIYRNEYVYLIVAGYF